jgi:5-methylcytosine-specific restriction endonuclease McrA
MKCECGCGQDTKGGRYCRGHSSHGDQRGAQNRPEVREKISKALREKLNRPEVVEKYRRIQTEVQNRPEVKQKRCRGVRLYIEQGLLDPSTCAKCGLGREWNGEPLTLQLHHVNGVHKDDCLENLQYLCPNCHSQTDTYVGKKRV